MATTEFEPPLDAGIAHAVAVLRSAGIETFESCQGGDAHCFAEPTIRFHGTDGEGYRAIAAAVEANLPVADLRRAWRLDGAVIVGPWWEITLHTTGRAGAN